MLQRQTIMQQTLEARVARMMDFSSHELGRRSTRRRHTTGHAVNDRKIWDSGKFSGEEGLLSEVVAQVLGDDQ